MSLKGETKMFDVIDMESYKSGYKAGVSDGYETGYDDCRRELRRRRERREQIRERKIYFLKQKSFGILLVLFPFISGVITDWITLPVGLISIPLGLFAVFSNDMWLVNNYMLECEEGE